MSRKRPNLKTIIIIVLTCIYLILTLTKVKQNNNFFAKNNSEYISGVKVNAKVVRVIDGDTIEVQILSDEIKNLNQIEKVRFIGINTPELNLHKKEDKEYFAQEAYEFTKKELDNRYIKLSFDDISNMRDKYNRLLCYIWVDNFLFNKILIEAGYAKYYDNFDFNEKYMKLFENAEIYAKINNMGMWKNGK